MNYLTGYKLLLEILEKYPGCVDVLILFLSRVCLLVRNTDGSPVVGQDITVPASYSIA